MGLLPGYSWLYLCTFHIIIPVCVKFAPVFQIYSFLKKMNQADYIENKEPILVFFFKFTWYLHLWLGIIVPAQLKWKIKEHYIFSKNRWRSNNRLCFWLFSSYVRSFPLLFKISIFSKLIFIISICSEIYVRTWLGAHA